MLCFDNEDISDLSTKEDHLLPAAHCFGGGNANESSAKEKHLLPVMLCFDNSEARKRASKGIKDMQPKQSIDDDENATT